MARVFSLLFFLIVFLGGCGTLPPRNQSYYYEENPSPKPEWVDGERIFFNENNIYVIGIGEAKDLDVAMSFAEVDATEKLLSLKRCSRARLLGFTVLRHYYYKETKDSYFRVFLMTETPKNGIICKRR